MDPNATMAANYGQIAGALIGSASLFRPTYWSKCMLDVVTESRIYQPTRDVNTFLGTTAFVLAKRPTGVLGMLVRNVLTKAVVTGSPAASTTIGPYAAAWSNNLGDQIYTSITHRYSSNILHTHDGEYMQLKQRLVSSEIDEDARSALTLGGLPRTAVGTPEQERASALIGGYAQTLTTTVYTWLDYLWFTRSPDVMWMPEAYSTEALIELTYNDVGNLIYTNTGTGTIVTTKPTVQSVVMFVRECYITIPEKMSRLALHNEEKGVLALFADLERQRGYRYTGVTLGAAREIRVKLDNIRLDVKELMFIIRRATGSATLTTDPTVDATYAGDKLQGPVYQAVTGAAVTSVLATAPRVDVIVDELVSFRIDANGARLFDDIPADINRLWMRKLYHNKSQVREYVYFWSPSFLPDDEKMVTSFQNAANLGNLELVLNVLDAPLNTARQVDVWVESYNLIQSRRGDCVKSLK